METEHTSPQRNYHRSLLAIAELIKAIVEEMSEQEVEQSSSQQQFTDEFSATDLDTRGRTRGSPFVRRCAVILHQTSATNHLSSCTALLDQNNPTIHIVGNVADEPLGLVRAQMRIEEMSEMTKAEIVAELEAMAWNRLYNCPQWLPDMETIWAVDQKLIKMGLVERISSDTRRNTPLGTELNIDLFQVFMGLFDVWEVPFILEDHRLIDEWESDGIYARMARKANPELVLAGVVRRAYLDYGKATRFLH